VIALPEPTRIAAAGEHARRRFIDFFTAHVIILRRERVGAGCAFAPGADSGLKNINLRGPGAFRPGG
jgi:hypothetical protein